MAIKNNTITNGLLLQAFSNYIERGVCRCRNRRSLNRSSMLFAP